MYDGTVSGTWRLDGGAAYVGVEFSSRGRHVFQPSLFVVTARAHIQLLIGTEGVRPQPLSRTEGTTPGFHLQSSLRQRGERLQPALAYQDLARHQVGGERPHTAHACGCFQDNTAHARGGRHHSPLLSPYPQLLGNRDDAAAPLLSFVWATGTALTYRARRP